ncbi:hypothetical protein [Nesterenkonia populi]|uniref:hypothetical protein n=1 Tax=Nesterenkonia populi TaxID=1591087 RepID=UPI0011BDCEEE|nr:hypothetical protein [Nesterenkonia populi]
MWLAPILWAERLELIDLVMAGIFSISTTAVIGVAGVIAAWRKLKPRLDEIQRNSAESAHQTKNDHVENLRDSLDRRFDSLDQHLSRQDTRLVEVERAVSRQWQRTADLGSRDDRIDDRLMHLEWQQRKNDG